MYAASRSRGLGLAPVIVAAAIPVAVGLIKGAPAYNGIDVFFDRAVSGDPAAVTELARLAQETTRPALFMKNFYAYAKAKWAEYQARVSSGSAVPLWYGTAAGQGPESPSPSPIAATLQEAVSNPVVLLGGAAAVYFLLRRRRAR